MIYLSHYCLPIFFPSQCDPPIEVNDLFRDIQDGHILMALLEEISGCKLVRISHFVLTCLTAQCVILIMMYGKSDKQI